LKLLIAYGTLTFNTELVAQKVYDVLKEDTNWELVDLKSMYDIQDVSELEQYDCFIFSTSSWDNNENDYPPDTEDFVAILKENPPNIEGKKAAFFGLGESHYEHFCGGIANLAKLMIDQYKVIQIGEIKTIDGYPEDPILDDMSEWAKAITKQI